MTAKCPDCNTIAPPAGAAAWLAAHKRTAHNLPRRLVCRPCRRGAIVNTLRQARDFELLHATCGLADALKPQRSVLPPWRTPTR